MKVIPETHRAY